jgi:glutathione peroxidase
MSRWTVCVVMTAMVFSAFSTARVFAEPGTPAESKSKSKKKEKQATKESDPSVVKSKKNRKPSGPLDFTMKDIDGTEQDLNQYSGKVVLMVNVASKCGFTPQYKGLEALYQKYHEQGFIVLAFPANDFGKQEPWPEAQIKSYCTSKYNVTFPMFSKVSVVGGKQCPLYKYLTKKSGSPFEGAIQWNFTKFLINRKGQVVARYDSRTDPQDPKVIEAVEKALAEESTEKSSVREKPAKP